MAVEEIKNNLRRPFINSHRRSIISREHSKSRPQRSSKWLPI